MQEEYVMKKLFVIDWNDNVVEVPIVKETPKLYKLGKCVSALGFRYQVYKDDATLSFTMNDAISKKYSNLVKSLDKAHKEVEFREKRLKEFKKKFNL